MTTMSERIKLIRKEAKLSQQEFGERIGVKGSSISTYELGRNQPIDAVIASICNEYKINAEWLRTGDGEMYRYIDQEDALAAEFARLLNRVPVDDQKRKLVAAICRLNDDEIAFIADLMTRLTEDIQ